LANVEGALKARRTNEAASIFKSLSKYQAKTAGRGLSKPDAGGL
jgi:hypothetical protein